MTDCVYIVAAMHGIALRHAQRAGIQLFKTVTLASSLRGLSKTSKVVVVDSKVTFTDHRAMQKALERFTNVSHVPA